MPTENKKDKSPLPKLFKITDAQISAIIDITDTISAMVGTGDASFDAGNKAAVKRVDAFLKSNGIKRRYN